MHLFLNLLEKFVFQCCNEDDAILCYLLTPIHVTYSKQLRLEMPVTPLLSMIITPISILPPALN